MQAILLINSINDYVKMEVAKSGVTMISRGASLTEFATKADNEKKIKKAEKTKNNKVPVFTQNIQF